MSYSKTSDSSDENKNYNDIKSLNSIGSHKERKYDTIPFRLDLIKEFTYNKKVDPLVDFNNNETEYYINPTKKKIENGDCGNSKDIRYVLDKKIHDFYKIINDIGGKLRYIKSGTTGHTFMGITKPEPNITINYAVKVVAYPKKARYGDMNDITRPENAELLMIKTLSYFVVKKHSPHIVLPIGTFNTSIKPFLNLIKDNVVDSKNKKYNDFLKKYERKEYYNTVSILISEWANRGDLLDFIRKHYREFAPIHWKVFFFQLISVLAVIQSKFPAFRHNDLKANNILVHKIEQRGTLFSYTVNRHKYIVPSIGYQIKLWDFDFACIPGIVDNAKVNARWTTSINVAPTQNRYYDMHYFFNTLIKKGFFGQFMTESCIPKEAKDFVNRIVPPIFQRGKYVAKRGRILINKEYLLPDDVLKKDPYFSEFRGHPLKRKKKRNGSIYRKN